MYCLQAPVAVHFDSSPDRHPDPRPIHQNEVVTSKCLLSAGILVTSENHLATVLAAVGLAWNLPSKSTRVPTTVDIRPGDLVTLLNFCDDSD